MRLLQEKMRRYRLPQYYQSLGIYPYFRTIDSYQDTEVTMGGRRVLMFGSNAYLGLTHDARIIEASVEATRKYGTGCAGSRFLNGTLDLHLQLEHELAAFVGKDEALVYNTGFAVNEGVVSCLTGRSDVLFYDERDHASIIDGRRLSLSEAKKYRHNDIADLALKLQKYSSDGLRFIVTDSVFSMEGDVVNLPALCEVSQQHHATVMLDEAHGIGVFGPHGEGVATHYGLSDQIDLLMGTFSKSLASVGGFIAADSDTINFLRHHSRSYIFSVSLPPAATAAALAALHIIQQEPERRAALWNVTHYALRSFREAGFEIGPTESPIIPLYVRDERKTFEATAQAFEAGVFINPVIPPACAPQDTLVRVALMATHTHEQVDRAVGILRSVFDRLGIARV